MTRRRTSQFKSQKSDVVERMRHPPTSGRVSAKIYTRSGSLISKQAVDDSREGQRVQLMRTQGQRQSARSKKLGVTLAKVPGFTSDSLTGETASQVIVDDPWGDSLYTDGPRKGRR